MRAYVEATQGGGAAAAGAGAGEDADVPEPAAGEAPTTDDGGESPKDRHPRGAGQPLPAADSP